MRSLTIVLKWLGTAVLIATMLVLAAVPMIAIYYEMKAPLGDYQPVEAAIVWSELSESEISNVGRNSGTSTYDIRIEYEYAVDGVTYRSVPTYVDSFSASFDQAIAQAEAANFKIGDAIIAYYEPLNPGTSRLDVQRSWSYVIGLSIFSGIMLGGLAWAMLGGRR